MIEDDLILKIENAIPHDVCDMLVNRWTPSMSRKETYVSENGLMDSLYDTMLFDANSIVGKISLDIIDNARETWLNSMPQSYLPQTMRRHTNYVSHIRMMRYGKGSKIHLHVDYSNSSFTCGSVTLNLNDSYSGGDFSFFGGRKKFSLGKGDILIFPASPFFTHEVEEITDGERYSINCFMSAYPRLVDDAVSGVLEMFLRSTNAPMDTPI